MESFSVVDIYDTKGVEYLFVIAYLIILIAFWRFSSKPVQVMAKIKRAIGVLTENAIRIPQGIFYSRNHTWTHLEESGIANVGLDDMLKHITGEVKFVNLRNPGETVKKGQLLTEMDHNGKLLRILSPISGQILDTNALSKDHQESVTETPFSDGWICKIKPSNWIAETSSYFLAEAASIWAKKELERFKDFLAVSVAKHSPQTSMIALQDGGELRDNTLSELPNEVWMDFQKDFLNDT